MTDYTGKNLMIFKITDLNDLDTAVAIPQEEVPEELNKPAVAGRLANGFSVQLPGDDFEYIAIGIDKVTIDDDGNVKPNASPPDLRKYTGARPDNKDYEHTYETDLIDDMLAGLTGKISKT